jgi:hypothetical protein
MRFSEYFKMLKTGNCGTLIDTLGVVAFAVNGSYSKISNN